MTQGAGDKGCSAFSLKNSSGSAPLSYNELSKLNTKYFSNFALENYKRVTIIKSSHTEAQYEQGMWI